jgi:hypothetical protein
MSAQPSQYGAGAGKKAVHVKVSIIKTKVRAELTYDPDEDPRHGDAFGHQLKGLIKKSLDLLRRLARTFCTRAIVPRLFSAICACCALFDLCSVGLFVWFSCGHGSINRGMTIPIDFSPAILLAKGSCFVLASLGDKCRLCIRSLLYLLM